MRQLQPFWSCESSMPIQAKCFKCNQPHAGDSCSFLHLTCLYCCGPHKAMDPSCSELARQKSIKIVMSTENITYSEATLRFRPFRKSFADSARPRTAQSPAVALFSPTSSPSHNVCPQH